MKRILFFVLLFGFPALLSAQLYRSSEFLVGGNVGLSYPMGKFGDVADRGFSTNVVARWILNEQIAVGIESGFTQFNQNDGFWDAAKRGENDVVYQLIPILLNGTYIFKAWDRDFKPYASVSFGYYLFRNHVDFTSSDSSPVPYNSHPSLEYTIKENKVGLAPGLGFMYHLSDYLTFDLHGRLTYLPNFPKFQSVRQKYTNVSEGIEKYFVEDEYSLGFEELTALSLSVGLFYRF